MQYDGSINIDTRIDTKGMNKGTKSITQSLGGVMKSIKGIAAALAAAFIGGSIINALMGVMQSFDLMSSSIGGSVKSLSDSFGTLKGAFANLIATALAPLIPYITMVVQWLTTMLTTITQIVAALFGFKSTVGSIMTTTAGGAKKAAKEAKGALAAFDQINVLNTQKAEEAGGGGGGGGLTPPPTVVPPELLEKVQQFKEKMLEFLKPLFDAFQKIKDSPLWKTIGDGLKWVWENILVPFGKWFVQELLPKFLEVVAQAMDNLNAALVILQPVWQWFWDNVLKPAAEFVGDALLKFFDWYIEKLKEAKKWMEENQAAFQMIVVILAVVGAAILILAGGPVAILIAAIVAIIAIILNWGKIWEWIKNVAGMVWGDIQKVWQSAKDWFNKTVIEPIKNAFATALDWIKQKFENIFKGITNVIKGVINGIIDFINGMIRGILGGINAVINGVNAVGKFTGLGTISTVNVPQIPRLATGAVIPPNSEFLAVLGDQRTGRNIEAPEGLIRQIVSEEIGKVQANITIGFAGNLAGLVRELKPYIDKENVRIGGSLIRSGATTT